MAVATNWLGEAIKRRREQLGITQAELAQRLGLHKQTIVKYEAGSIAPATGRLSEVATALEMSLSRLLDVEGDLVEAGIPIDDEGYMIDEEGHRLDDAVRSPPLVVRERPPLEARHARNLPLSVREYLAEFRLRLTKGGATEEEIDEALELMRSPQVFTFYKGGALSEYSEDEVLRGMKAIGESVVIPELRERGRKIS